MSAQTGYGRWWENYLVRYLMPSIAGMIIVNWLMTISGDNLKEILLFSIEKNIRLDGPNLVLLFLYGNLFCYIASYPILVFHGTRVLDFERNSWKHRIHDGYIWTLIVFLLSIFATQLPNECHLALGASFIIVSIFALSQMYRIFLVLKEIEYNSSQIKDKSSLAYSFVHMLGVRRGKIQDISTNINKKQFSNGSESGTKETKRTNIWRNEIVETYRHMREHGNSAFIFALEIVLAAACFSIVDSDFNTIKKLSILGILLAIWAAPAVCIHLLGQHLERRFSLYDFKNESK
jgi:hypothetical protein